MSSLTGKKLILDIGSGKKHGLDADFVGIDAYTEADVNANMWDLPYEDNSVDAILSSNSLEHISKFLVIPTLREWGRVLKPAGVLKLLVPDLVWACTFWLEHQDEVGWNLDIIYGNQQHEGEYHKTGFSVASLHKYFAEVETLKIFTIKQIHGEDSKRYAEEGYLEHVTQGEIEVKAYKV